MIITLPNSNKEEIAEFVKKYLANYNTELDKFIVQPYYDVDNLIKVSFTEEEFTVSEKEYEKILKEQYTSIYEKIKEVFLKDKSTTKFNYSIFITPMTIENKTIFYIVDSSIEKDDIITYLDFNTTLNMFVYLFKCYTDLTFIPCYPIINISEFLYDVINCKEKQNYHPISYLYNTSFIERLPSFKEPFTSFWFKNGFIIKPFDSIDFDTIIC